VGRTVLRVRRLKHIEVAYEDLVVDPSQFDRVRAFLSLPADEGVPESNILKTRTGRQQQVVANYGDVRARLQGTRFAALLD